MEDGLIILFRELTTPIRLSVQSRDAQPGLAYSGAEPLVVDGMRKFHAVPGGL